MTPKQAAVSIVRRLRNSGHTALFAGGCVRDMLLGHRPMDYDIATDAVPERILTLFRKTRRVGAQFGVVLVKQSHIWTEVATFRSDHNYADGRHPTQVTFTGPAEDAQRRDFTINGMFYDPLDDRVIDYVGGQTDLRNGLVRAIGDPDRRFAEDHLRLIRTIRFAARLGYEIEPVTYDAVCRHAASIRKVSAERIREELEKILADPHRAWAFRHLDRTALLEHLWPHSQWNPERKAFSAKLLDHLPKQASLDLSLACLLIHWAVPEVHRISRDLTCSNEHRKNVAWLIENRERLILNPRLPLADLKVLMRHACFADLIRLTRAWLRARGDSLSPYYRVLRRIGSIPHEDVAPPPLLNGADLISLGFPPGPLFKRVLSVVYRAQLEGQLHSRAEALALAQVEAVRILHGSTSTLQ